MAELTRYDTSKNDHPFGMLMPGRSYSSTAYKYGFNGKEKDDEVKGVGNCLDFGARTYDSRLGRWFKPDLLACAYSDLSPYNFAANSPVIFKDSDGETIQIAIEGLGLYTYNNGKLIDANGVKYTGNDRFANQALSDLNRIRTGGSEGFRLITELSQRIEDITIANTYFENRVIGNTLAKINNASESNLPTNERMQKVATFVTLAHELAHVEDFLHGMTIKLLGVPPKSIWLERSSPDGDDIIQGEKYATFIENLIRDENHIGLRTHYATKVDERHFQQPFENSRVINFDTKEHLFINNDFFNRIKPQPITSTPSPNSGNRNGNNSESGNYNGNSGSRENTSEPDCHDCMDLPD